ncbi:MAG: LD-carboxypeptidase [Chlorobiaceae bacterium]|jgi:muramoyltetrapeptide carboxypeptidase|nr:LD-carboxypeptidase [Chlorobiaceae bacterium]
MKILIPKALRKGEVVGLISPSSTCAEPEKIEQAVTYLERNGYRVKTSRYLNRSEHDPLHTDHYKLHDLHQMFADTEVRAIFCLRGGAGATRLLDRIDYSTIAANPKILVGYSDITALSLAIFRKTGLINFSGPMAATELHSPSSYTEAHFWGILTDPKYPACLSNFPDHSISCVRPGSASGRLIGGNLSVLSSLVGTPYLPSFRGSLLFVEDVNEPAYRIDRMLSHLFNAGLAQQCRGFMFGQFSRNPSDENRDYRFNKIFTYYANRMHEGAPVMAGLSYGHVPELMTLPVGARCRIELSPDHFAFGTTEPVVSS